MIALELISPQLFPLKATDSCAYARELFEAYRISELPVSEQKKLLGWLSTKDIIDAEDEESIEAYFHTEAIPRIEPERHLLEIIKIFGDLHISTLPVVNKEDELEGIISLKDIVKHLADSLTLQQEGCIVSIRLPAPRYSLHEFTRIAESENIRIIGLVIHAIPESEEVVVSFKLNSNFPDAFASACERLGYLIYGTYSMVSQNDDIRDRYEALMKYLDL